LREQAVNNEIVLIKVQQALVTVVQMSAPVLIATVIVGVLVGLLQALTQIQDQSLPQALKLVVVLFIMIFFGAWLGSQVAREASALLDEFPIATR
jgi:type III secretion protein S